MAGSVVSMGGCRTTHDLRPPGGAPNEVAGHLNFPTTPRTPPIIDILGFVALGLGVVIAVAGLVYARRLRDSVAASREVETARLHEERGAAEQ